MLNSLAEKIRFECSVDNRLNGKEGVSVGYFDENKSFFYSVDLSTQYSTLPRSNSAGTSFGKFNVSVSIGVISKRLISTTDGVCI